MSGLFGGNDDPPPPRRSPNGVKIIRVDGSGGGKGGNDSILARGAAMGVGTPDGASLLTNDDDKNQRLGAGGSY